MLLGSAAAARADGPSPGGNCCVDLEERVSELEATVVRKGNRRVSLTISGQVTTHLMYWNDGGSDRSLKYSSSQLQNTYNPGTRSSDLYIVDNMMAAGGTSFMFNGDAKINPNLTAGFQVQIGLLSGSRSAGSGGTLANAANAVAPNGVTQIDDDGAAPADTNIVLTLANWYLDHKTLGRVTVGRANTATAGISAIDLGGASVIAGSSLGYWNGNMFLISDNTLINANWGDVLGHGSIRNGALSRANVISYTSPTFDGFSVAAAWGENNLWDVGLRYAGEFSGFRLAAGIGYISNTTGFGDQVADIPANEADHLATPSVWKGSASILHVASGLFLTGAYLDRDNDNGKQNTTLWYAQAGVSKNWTGVGNTVLYGEYSKVYDGLAGCSTSPTAAGKSGSSFSCDDRQDFGFGAASTAITNVSSDATVWGLGVVQYVDAAAMELYLAYRHYEASAVVDGHYFNFNDADIVVGGARVKF